VIAAVVAVVLVVVYALGAGVWVSSGSGFYESLDRPPWQPPDVLFGLIWPYNFVVLGVAGVVVALTGSASARIWWLTFTALSVVAALGWAYLFYVGESLWPSAVALALATVLTIPVLAITWRTAWVSGVLLIPYLLWLGTATSLAVGYAVRNPV
jgi:tryptophan-rich sensory protein